MSAPGGFLGGGGKELREGGFVFSVLAVTWGPQSGRYLEFNFGYISGPIPGGMR